MARVAGAAVGTKLEHVSSIDPMITPFQLNLSTVVVKILSLQKKYKFNQIRSQRGI